MTPDYIRAELIRRGVTLVDIARTLDVNRRTVSNVVRGKNRSRRVEDEISRVLGLRRDELFPVRHVARG